MQPSNYHQLLLKQIQETLGADQNVVTSIQPLLQQISDTYQKLEENTRQTEAKVELRTSQLIASTSNAYSFLDSLNMGFIMFDVNAQVVLTNQSVRHILATKISGSNNIPTLRETYTEWTIDSIDSQFQPELHLKDLVLQCLKSNKPLESKAVNFGKQVLHMFISPMINEVSQGDKQQIGAVILIEDITEQKVLERSKDEFLSIASHELRTPLTAIRGNASLLKKYYANYLPDIDSKEMIDDIHISSIRLIEIVNDFLDVSALEQGKIIMKPETFLLDEVVSEVIRELQYLCDEKSIKLVKDPAISAAPAVTADKQRTKQVLYNLVGNSVKFTEAGSITISVQVDDKFVYTIVTDTGKGMSAENQRLLFRKFQQAGDSLLTRDNTKGTGLGLYISKLIVELSGGKIALRSSVPDKGSSFYFSLPIAK